VGQVREWDETTADALEATSVLGFELVPPHPRAVTCIALTESRIVTGSSDHTLRVWDFGVRPSPTPP
jgi:WD40 repeat protein